MALAPKGGQRHILADSGEGYTTKQACLDGIDLVKSCANAPVVEQ